MGKHDPQRFTDAGALPVEPEGFGPWYLAQRSDRELDEAGALCKARRTMELEVYRARLGGATYREIRETMQSVSLSTLRAWTNKVRDAIDALNSTSARQ